MKANMFLNDFSIKASEVLIPLPKISVLLPTYCRGNNGLLRRAIDSVLGQTFKEFELIVIDDGSVDETETIITNYLKQDYRIVYIRNKTNSGLPSLRINQGMRFVRGQYIAYQFDDDFWLEDALENLYDVIKDQEVPSLVYGKVELKMIKKGDVYPFVNKFEYYDLQKRNCIANNAVLHSKELPWLYGSYDCHLALRRLCDWDLWLRWAKEVPFIFLDKVISRVEAEHEGSIGLTCPLDLECFRLFQSQYRNYLLSPDTFGDYDLDILDFIEMSNKLEAVYNQHILPWYLEHIELIDKPIQYTYANSKKKIIVTKNDYDATLDITLTNFANILKKEYQLIYVPEEQLCCDYLNYCDILIFHRTFHAKNLKIIEQAKAKNIPTFYLLDDDLLNANQLGEDFDWINNWELYVSLMNQLMKVDMVIVYSEGIKRSVVPFNKHVIQLKTNILKDYIKRYEERETTVFKIAFSGGGGRKEEIEFIWKELLEISNKYKEKVVFYFWGYRPERLVEMTESKWFYEAFTFSYYEYLSRLARQTFDIFLAPLFSNALKKSKSPIKYLESVACGAIGLYSEVEPYSVIIDNVNGIKVKNQPGEWGKKVEKVIQMKQSEKIRIYENAFNDIQSHYTTESQSDLFHKAIACGCLYHVLGEGVICYIIKTGFITDRERRLLSHALLTKKHGYEVMICTGKLHQEEGNSLTQICQTFDIPLHCISITSILDTRYIDIGEERKDSEQLISLINDRNIKLIHSVNLCVSVELACRTMNIAHIMSVFDVYPEYLQPSPYLPKAFISDTVYYTNIWKQKIGGRARCIRSYFDETYFLQHEDKLIDDVSQPTDETVHIGISGNLRSTKGHHKVIEAISRFKEKSIYIHLDILCYEGYSKEYQLYLKNLIKKYAIESQVIFHFDKCNYKKIMRQLRGWIIAGKYETFSWSILGAISEKLPIITVPAPGILEWVKDGITGLVSKGFESNDIEDVVATFINNHQEQPKKLNKMAVCLHQILKKECNENKVATELFNYYYSVLNEQKCTSNIEMNKIE